MIKKQALLGLIISLSLTSAVFAEEEMASSDQNLKDEKINFAKQAVNENTFSGHMLIDKISNYQIFAGSVIPGILVTGMNSDLPGTIIGQVSQNVFDSIEGKYLLINSLAFMIPRLLMLRLGDTLFGKDLSCRMAKAWF